MIGPVNLPSEMANDASALYAKNLSNLLDLLVEDGKLKLISRMRWSRAPRSPITVRSSTSEPRKPRRFLMDLMTEITIFVLAAFVGFEVISKVPTTLHTPLMSQTNAIHGIVVLGGFIVLGYADDALEKTIGFIAVAFGTINVVGGFMVTDRMLSMFVRKPKPALEESSTEPLPAEGSGSAETEELFLMSTSLRSPPTRTSSALPTSPSSSSSSASARARTRPRPSGAT